MNPSELLADAFQRVHDVVHHVVDGLEPDQLSYRVTPEANSIAWLVWHLTRVQDDHVADVAGTEQVWTSSGWADRFGLPFEVEDTGYSHTASQVDAVEVQSAELLTGYYDATHEATTRYLATLTDADLDRVVDERWDPPVTLGVRLVSVINDDLQHAGQAAYVRGLLPSRRA
ncbi:MAG TPA: DinB family protein [Actinomycetota bacterium]|nr:DinB family protein [Actinomycetota bacterium]